MKVIFLGQAGLLFDFNGTKVMIDPYLSNSVERINPKQHRRLPINHEYLQVKPDIVVFTHNHLDHYDPQTAAQLITADTKVTVLAPTSVWDEVRKIGGENNFVLFDTSTEWSEKGLHFTAVKAVHSDRYAIGVLLDDGDKTYYVTGDTLYSEEILRTLPKNIYAVFLPINGVGNNMNMTDAARFARKIGAKKSVPFHFGMFDDIDASQFCCKNKVIPHIYQEVAL